MYLPGNPTEGEHTVRDLSKDPTQLYVKENVQTFVDNVTIYSTKNVTRRWYRPQRHSAGPVIQRDRPWEHIPYFTLSNYCVLRDPEDGLLKCWYEDLELIAHTAFAAGVYHSRQLYAESEDGIHWNKPDFGIVTENGHGTNIVLGAGAGGAGEVHSMNVVIDPRPPSGEHRFRALFTNRGSGETLGRNRLIEAAHSSDGMHWHVYDEKPSFGMSYQRLEDVTMPFYDEESREFVQNTRHFLMETGAFGAPYGGLHHFASCEKRRVWQCRSHDFIHWSEPVLVAAPDDEDNLDELYYGLCQYKLGSVYLGTMGLFHQVDNEVSVRLLTSRDGIRWAQTANRQAFFSPRGEGYFDAHMVQLAAPPIDMGDELWFYYGASSTHHDWWLWGPAENMDHPEARDPSLVKYCLAIATLRRDGYASLYANRYREGILETQSLISSGGQLVVNARCNRGGSIRVAVCDQYNQVVEPCTEEGCDPFTGDCVAHTMTWKGSPVIPVRRWRKLRFYLRDAELFSFRFAETSKVDPG